MTDLSVGEEEGVATGYLSDPPRGEVVFVPLGGAGEIGMNLSLYGFNGSWIAVDLGIAFGDDATPGVDVLVPDTSFIRELPGRLDALFITHAHEDHLGAIPYLWHRFRCPIYASPFAAGLIEHKLSGQGTEERPDLRIIEPQRHVTVGAFEVEYVRAAHSIPEAHILALRCRAGTIVHATDWKMDDDPLVGYRTDEKRLREIGDEGVMALVCDSTNVFVEEEAGSEGKLREAFIDLIKGIDTRIAVACFASNVARLDTVAAAAKATGRSAALVGRSMWRTTEIARQCGYLADSEPFLTEHDVGYLPREKTIIAVTGSQGEPRSALSRIAMEDHPEVNLEPGDVVIFSSKKIPGNELAIARIENQLSRRGIRIITDDDAFVHVSGHPAREELVKLYQWLKPETLVPIHGETRMLHEQADLAADCQIPQTAIVENGMALRLGPGRPEIVDYVTSGRLALDGTRLVPVDGNVIRSRRRLNFAGSAVATVVIDRRGHLVAEPQVSIQGLIDREEDGDISDYALDAIHDAMDRLSKSDRRDDAAVSEAVRIAVRRSLRGTTGKRPITDVHVVRV